MTYTETQKAAVLAAENIPTRGFEFEGITIPYATCRNWREAAQLEKVESLKSERVSLIGQALELEKELQKLKAEKKGVEQSLESIVQSAKAAVSKLELTKEKLENELLISMEFVSDLASDNENLKTENESLKSDNETLKSKLLTLQNSISQKTGIFKDKVSVFIIFILFLAANVYHNASGYTSIAGNTFGHWAFAIIVVISIDLAVLVFTVHSMKVQAAVYSIGTFVVTFLHFNPQICRYSNHIISFIFALAFSFGIWSFSELFKEKL